MAKATKSKINDYLVEYHFKKSEPEIHHFSFDGIFRLHEEGATITKIYSIKNPPYCPIDVTGKTLALIERMK